MILSGCRYQWRWSAPLKKLVSLFHASWRKPTKLGDWRSNFLRERALSWQTTSCISSWMTAAPPRRQSGRSYRGLELKDWWEFVTTTSSWMTVMSSFQSGWAWSRVSSIRRIFLWTFLGRLCCGTKSCAWSRRTVWQRTWKCSLKLPSWRTTTRSSTNSTASAGTMRTPPSESRLLSCWCSTRSNLETSRTASRNTRTAWRKDRTTCITSQAKASLSYPPCSRKIRARRGMRHPTWLTLWMNVPYSSPRNSTEKCWNPRQKRGWILVTRMRRKRLKSWTPNSSHWRSWWRRFPATRLRRRLSTTEQSTLCVLTRSQSSSVAAGERGQEGRKREEEKEREWKGSWGQEGRDRLDRSDQKKEEEDGPDLRQGGWVQSDPDGGEPSGWQCRGRDEADPEGRGRICDDAWESAEKRREAEELRSHWWMYDPSHEQVAGRRKTQGQERPEGEEASGETKRTRTEVRERTEERQRSSDSEEREGGSDPGVGKRASDDRGGGVRRKWRRRETVGECGEQPQEPRRKCATRERLQGEKGRNGSKGRQREQKATLCTLSSTLQLQPPPQQPQQLQRQCACNDAHDFRRNADFMDVVNESDDLTQDVFAGMKRWTSAMLGATDTIQDVAWWSSTSWVLPRSGHRSSGVRCGGNGRGRVLGGHLLQAWHRPSRHVPRWLGLRVGVHQRVLRWGHRWPLRALRNSHRPRAEKNGQRSRGMCRNSLCVCLTLSEPWRNSRRQTHGFEGSFRSTWRASRDIPDWQSRCLRQCVHDNGHAANLPAFRRLRHHQLRGLFRGQLVQRHDHLAQDRAFGEHRLSGRRRLHGHRHWLVGCTRWRHTLITWLCLPSALCSRVRSTPPIRSPLAVSCRTWGHTLMTSRRLAHRTALAPWRESSRTWYGTVQSLARSLCTRTSRPIPATCTASMSTAPVDEPTAMSFTVPLTRNTIVATAAVVTTCSASANCTDSLTLTWSGSVCMAMSCGGGSFTPDGAYDSLWDSVKPMTGKYTINYFQYQEDVGCVCMLNDRTSSNDEICPDNYNYFRFKLKGKGRSETWEVCPYGDKTIKMDRDSAEVLSRGNTPALVVSAVVRHQTWQCTPSTGCACILSLMQLLSGAQVGNWKGVWIWRCGSEQQSCLSRGGVRAFERIIHPVLHTSALSNLILSVVTRMSHLICTREIIIPTHSRWLKSRLEKQTSSDPWPLWDRLVFPHFQRKKRVQVSASFWEKKKEVRLRESCSRKSSILWVEIERSSILWVIWKKRFNSLSHEQRRFNSVSHFQKSNGSILCVIFEKKSSIRVIFNKRYSLSHIQKKSTILWLIVKKSKDLLFEYWVYFQKKFSNFQKKQNKFFELHFLHMLNSLNHMKKLLYES